METILTVKEESMVAVADAVREKSGTTESLSFPDGMVSAINSIETSIAAVEVDNKTIIQDENGVISTAIGGYRTEAVPGYTVYETSENLNPIFDTFSTEQIYEMNGYFTLPNWSPIEGNNDFNIQESGAKFMRASWEEYPLRDDPSFSSTAYADVFWSDISFRTLQVENIQGSELIHSASIDNETGYFGGLAPHIYEDQNSYDGVYITNFKIEVPETEAGFSPIDARFLPTEITDAISNNNMRAEEAIMRANDLQIQIDDIRNNSAGASISADGLTIIEEGGVIKTAIGGSKVLVNPSEDKFYYEDGTGFDAGDNRPNFSGFTIPSDVSIDVDYTARYEVEIDVRHEDTGVIDNLTGYSNPGDNTTVTLYGNFTISDSDVTIQSWKPSRKEFWTNGKTYGLYYITRIVFRTIPQYEYSKIDSNFIDIGDGLAMENGKICGSINNITGKSTSYSQSSYVLQNGNTITDPGSADGTAAFGNRNTVYGAQGDIALGRDNTHSAGGSPQISIGDKNSNRNGYNYFAIGVSNTNRGNNNLLIGHSNQSNDSTYSFIFGRNNYTSYLNYGFMAGSDLIAGSNNQFIYGTGNLQDTSGTYNVIIGNSLDTSNRANGLTIDTSGNVVVQGTISNGGADYAEYFEWLDGNTNKEDRIGLLVALDGSKIRLAEADDDILGIVSGTATILGDDAEWMWQGKYEKDDFGRVIMEEKEIFHEEPIYNEDGTELLGYEMISSGTTLVPKISPYYNENETYISRANRAEWSPIGMMGKLYVRDDGTCKVNEYAAAAHGIATAASGKTNMRVMERVADNIIRVCLK